MTCTGTSLDWELQNLIVFRGKFTHAHTHICLHLNIMYMLEAWKGQLKAYIDNS